MSSSDVQERARALRRDRVPFVHARVVRAEKPTSARPGDEALVLAGGAMEGFVGGTCADATVRAQALALLDAGGTRMLRISPRDESDRDLPADTVLAHNPCLSGGALEIFLEAVVPPPLVVVHGEGPVSTALFAFGKPLGYEIGASLDGPSLDEASAVVVAAHGRDEEAAIRTALDAGVPYVGLVASPRRGQAVVALLGLTEEESDRLHTPAGLDIGAVSAEEIALSILAQIVALRPRPDNRLDTRAQLSVPTEGSATAIDLVCGMTVAAVPASLHLDHRGTRYWFCGSGCLRAFSADPAGYTKGS
jgi:xanthine dehydrogenase accessory factor